MRALHYIDHLLSRLHILQPYKTNKETHYITAELFPVQKARAKVKAYNSKLSVHSSQQSLSTL